MHDALSEHKSLTVSIVLLPHTLLLSAPIIVLTRNDAVVKTFAIASVIFLTNACSIGMLVGPRVYLLKRGTVITLETIRPDGIAQSAPHLPRPGSEMPTVTRGSSSSSTSAPSKVQPRSGSASAKVAPDMSSSVLLPPSSSAGERAEPTGGRARWCTAWYELFHCRDGPSGRPVRARARRPRDRRRRRTAPRGRTIAAAAGARKVIRALGTADTRGVAGSTVVDKVGARGVRYVAPGAS
jgi:hypothetical protein